MTLIPQRWTVSKLSRVSPSAQAVVIKPFRRAGQAPAVFDGHPLHADDDPKNEGRMRVYAQPAQWNKSPG